MASNASKQKAAPRYACALCGRKSRADEMVFSTHTHNRYCGTDINGCLARRRRQRAKEARS